MSGGQKEGNEQIFGERIQYHDLILTLRILFRDDSVVFISDDWPRAERIERNRSKLR